MIVVAEDRTRCTAYENEVASNIHCCMYRVSVLSNTNKEAFSEIQDTSYTPPEYRITEKAILGDINVSIPVTLESNLKHINGSHVNNSGDFEDDTHILINKKYKKGIQGQLPSSEFSSNNNNNIICSKQVTYI